MIIVQLFLGDDFSKKIEEEITEEPVRTGYPGANVQKRPTVSPSDLVQQRFFESGMRADPNDPNFGRSQNNQNIQNNQNNQNIQNIQNNQNNQKIRRRFRPRLHMRPRGQFQQNQQQIQQNQQIQKQQKVFVSDYDTGLENKGALSRGATLATLDRRPNRPAFHHMGPPPGMF